MSIELITGPMFSGKTSEMFRRVKRLTIAGFEPLILRFSEDTRYSTSPLASSHDLEQLWAVPVSDPYDAIESACNAQVIGIDEGQFMTNLREFCEEMASLGTVVIVAGLDSDFQRNGFPAIVNLMPVAESVTKLSAICFHCKGSASFSRRLDVSNQEIKIIGGAEKYVASCRKCFTKAIDPEKLGQYYKSAERVKLLISK